MLLLAAGLFACTGKPRYLEFRRVDENGWDKDSVLSYVFDADDTTDYDILIHVRHTDRYPYQNMWLFVGDGDTIEFYLADDYGRWLGEKGMHHINMPVLYEHAYRFDSTGTHTLNIRHGMRQDLLQGITDVGVEIRQATY